MKAVGPSANGRNWQEACLGDRQLRGVARAGVRGVLIEGHEHVVAIVPAIQENAYQRSVIRSSLGSQGVNCTKCLQAGGQRYTAERAGAIAKEISSCCCHDIYLCMSYWEDVAVR